MSKTMRVKFIKHGDMIYISHLDVQRLLQRAFRRAAIELSYSQGFNPHPKMSYGNALALGVESFGEYVDIEIEDDISSEEVMERINEQLPDGMSFVKCVELTGGEMALAPNIVYGDYEFIIPNIEAIDKDVLDERINNMINSESIITSKLNKKKKLVELDIRPMIKELNLLDADEYKLRVGAVLATGSVQNLNTNVFNPKLLEYLGINIDPLDIDIIRKGLFFELDKKMIAPL